MKIEISFNASTSVTLAGGTIVSPAVMVIAFRWEDEPEGGEIVGVDLNSDVGAEFSLSSRRLLNIQGLVRDDLRSWQLVPAVIGAEAWALAEESLRTASTDRGQLVVDDTYITNLQPVWHELIEARLGGSIAVLPPNKAEMQRIFGILDQEPGLLDRMANHLHDLAQEANKGTDNKKGPQV